MKITVLNGSPKGANSITLQTINYLELLYPEHTFTVFHVGQKINSYAKDPSEVITAMLESELILFCYPVYTFIAPSQLHRFISILKEKGVDLKGKYVSQITTSKHFYDVTAHNYIRDNCQDLGMCFVNGLSADMEDLPKEKGQAEAKNWFEYLVWCVENGVCENKLFTEEEYQPIPASPAAEQPKTMPKKVVIVTDRREDDDQLRGMIQLFRNRLPMESKVVNIREYPFKGGCLGCMHCAPKGICVYKDGFDTFLREEIQKTDAIVYAFRIEDHSMGWVFKQYDDRQFCNGHRTVTMGMPFGYLISGPYSKEFNLRTIVEARAEVGGNFLAGVAGDEHDTDSQIDRLAQRLTYAIEKRYTQPSNFYGVGGMKIFRDLIYMTKGMMRADHKFYKAHGQYDFPQKHRGKVAALYLVGAMMSSKKLSKKIGGKMTEGMLMPYKKVLDKVRADQSKR